MFAFVLVHEVVEGGGSFTVWPNFLFCTILKGVFPITIFIFFLLYHCSFFCFLIVNFKYFVWAIPLYPVLITMIAYCTVVGFNGFATTGMAITVVVRFWFIKKHFFAFLL